MGIPNSAAPRGGAMKPPPEGIDQTRAGIIHAASEAIITIDDQQRVVMINRAAQQLFGCSADEALGTDLSRFLPHRYRDRHAAFVQGFDQSGATESAMHGPRTVRGLRSNGEEFPLEAHITRLDASGQFGARRYFTVLMRDVSELQGLRAELRAMKAQLRAILELVPVAIWITEGERVSFANRACQALFGATDGASLVGRPLSELMSVDAHATLREKLAQALASGTPVVSLQETITRLDGTVREVEVALAPLPDHGKTALQMVITDITERNRENQRLARSRAELRRLSAKQVQAREEERRSIARELHDELGQHLMALRMTLGHEGAAGLDNGASLLSMVDATIASVRRIAADLRPPMLDDLGLVAALEWLTGDWSRRFGVTVALDLRAPEERVDERLSITVYRIVQEALTNVARHARASQVRVALLAEGQELVLTVQDNGVGGDEQAARHSGNFGLMGIRERAHMHGGEFEAGNVEGGGWRVQVRLPLPDAQG